MIIKHSVAATLAIELMKLFGDSCMVEPQEMTWTSASPGERKRKASL
jgi:hypothetical protein